MQPPPFHDAMKEFLGMVQDWDEKYSTKRERLFGFFSHPVFTGTHANNTKENGRSRWKKGRVHAYPFLISNCLKVLRSKGFQGFLSFSRGFFFLYLFFRQKSGFLLSASDPLVNQFPRGQHWELASRTLNSTQRCHSGKNGSQGTEGALSKAVTVTGMV